MTEMHGISSVRVERLELLTSYSQNKHSIYIYVLITINKHLGMKLCTLFVLLSVVVLYFLHVPKKEIRRNSKILDQRREPKEMGEKPFLGCCTDSQITKKGIVYSYRQYNNPLISVLKIFNLPLSFFPKNIIPPS